MKKSYQWAIELFIIILIISGQPVFATIDVEMILNDGGFVSFDHFKAELYLFNHVATVPDARIFGILEIAGEFYYWPDFETVASYRELVVEPGESYLTFLEFNFPDIDEMIPFGPMSFWGAWYVDAGYYGYDVKEFWLGAEHKWTPTPMATFTPEPTNTPAPPTSTPTSTPSSAPAGFVYVDAGSFVMNSSIIEPCWGDGEEGPQFEVTLTRGFFMMQTEVTRQIWADLKAVQPTLPDDPSDITLSPTLGHPVQQNSWYEAVLFANLMSLHEGYTRCYYEDEEFTIPIDATNYTSGTIFCKFHESGYRLPTEAEWEYACRAGTAGPFSCDEPEYTWENCEICQPGVHPTLEQYSLYCMPYPSMLAVSGSKLPNPFGLYDMHGSVSEWCWDLFWTYPGMNLIDPTGPTSTYEWSRVVRGGSWVDMARHCRSASRWSSGPGFFHFTFGFRLLRIAPE